MSREHPARFKFIDVDIFVETTEEQFDRVFSINLKAPYFLVAELALPMASRGKGAIGNLSTMAADYGAAGMSLYGSSKAAIHLMTKTWTAEYGPKGVRVNAVSPGPTRTEGTDPMGEGLEQLAVQAPTDCPETPERSLKQLSCWGKTRSISFTEQNLQWTKVHRNLNINMINLNVRLGRC